MNKITKGLLIFIVFLIITVFHINQLYALDVSFGPVLSYITDETIEDDIGIEASMARKNWFLKMSYEHATKFFYGQTVGDYNLSSIRIGYKAPLKKLFDGVSLSFDFGYYNPLFNFKKGSGNEGVYAKMHSMADKVNGGPFYNWKPEGICCESTKVDYIFDTCDIEISSGFGGNIGMNYTKEWKTSNNKSIGITTDVRYRYLVLNSQITANIKGLPYEENVLRDGLPYHIFHLEENFNGFQFWTGLVIRF